MRELLWKIEPKPIILRRWRGEVRDGWWLVGWCLLEVGSGRVSEVDCALLVVPTPSKYAPARTNSNGIKNNGFQCLHFRILSSADYKKSGLIQADLKKPRSIPACSHRSCCKSNTAFSAVRDTEDTSTRGDELNHSACHQRRSLPAASSVCMRVCGNSGISSN